ncbi:MAG: chorismate mutase [Bacilli bacterium]|nr:chorismate mutase [Bacilli bacterium]
MTRLEELRKEIDEIDKQISILFNERMNIVKKINIYKKNNNIDVLDTKREEYLLQENLKHVDKEYQDLYLELEKKILSLSKEYQNK